MSSGTSRIGQLTEAVRRRPYTVVLFDKVEKAHPDVFDVLLRVLDEGRLTDGQGRTVGFRNTILILTSSLGSGGDKDFVMAAVRFGVQTRNLSTASTTSSSSTLSAEELVSIVDIQLGQLGKRLAQRRLRLEVSANAKVAGRPRIRPAVWRPAAASVGAAGDRRPTRQVVAGTVRGGDVVPSMCPPTGRAGPG